MTKPMPNKAEAPSELSEEFHIRTPERALRDSVQALHQSLAASGLHDVPKLSEEEGEMILRLME